MRSLSVIPATSILIEGWQEVTINDAVYGEWEGHRFIDVFFEELPRALNLRVYETFNSYTGEEFAIGNVFRFANAGLERVEYKKDGTLNVVINDDPRLLLGKKLSVFLYKEESGYFRILNRFAPGKPYSNEYEIMDELRIGYFRRKAEDYYQQYVSSRIAAEKESTPF